jgi:hypothetical protein
MKTTSQVDTTLFTLIIATLVTGICLSSFSSLTEPPSVRPDSIASKTVASKQI